MNYFAETVFLDDISLRNKFHPEAIRKQQPNHPQNRAAIRNFYFLASQFKI